ncbi:MAG: NADPH-dependent FMN reductase, partial [Bacteroidota bacterium]
REKKDGIPEAAHRLLQHLTSADGLVISFAEHNGNVTAVWKNLEDWISRIDRNAWRQKPLFLLATSPGGRGGQSALAISSRIYSFRNPYPIAQFSLPGFRKNFTGADIADEKLKRDFETQLQQFEAALKNPVSTA